jgi:hypothetical protein
VVFKEVRRKSKSEVVQKENNLEKVKFEVRNEEEDDSDESTKSDEEVEQSTSFVSRSKRVRKAVERYSSPDFPSSFVLISTDEEPKSVREVVDSTKSRIWKDTKVDEMKSLHKNETWDLVKLSNGINHIDSKWAFKKKMNIIG